MSLSIRTRIEHRSNILLIRHRIGVIEHRRLDIVVVEEKNGKCIVIHITVPGDHNVRQKELEKKTKYEDLRIEIARLWIKNVSVIPVVVGAVGTLTANLRKIL